VHKSLDVEEYLVKPKEEGGRKVGRQAGRWVGR